MIQIVALINRSEHITDAQLVAMFQAMTVQLDQHVAPIWGLVPALECILGDGEPTPGAVPCYLEDVPDVDGALGYHDEDEDGNPYIKVFVEPTLSNGGTILDGPNSVSVTLSHELIELVGDWPANRWDDGPGGIDYAHELCDAVEGDSYMVMTQADKDRIGVAVSNFLFQDFFDPKAKPGTRLDYLGLLRKPFTMTAGGYQIKRTEPGKVTQIFAKHDPHHTVVDDDTGVVADFSPAYPRWKRALKGRRLRARVAQPRLAETPDEGTSVVEVRKTLPPPFAVLPPDSKPMVNE